MPSLKMKTVLSALAISFSLWLGGCGNAAQEKAYEHAVAVEQKLPSDRFIEVIAAYQQVIRLEPGSACAKKAQVRIEAVKAKASADELHKSVFQENGVD